MSFLDHMKLRLGMYIPVQNEDKTRLFAKAIRAAVDGAISARTAAARTFAAIR